jgi:hypothetical protein
MSLGFGSTREKARKGLSHRLHRFLMWAIGAELSRHAAALLAGIRRDTTVLPGTSVTRGLKA